MTRAPETEAAATARAGTRSTASPATDAWERSYGFEFDPFQRRACQALEDGASVLVAAPTGAGKTVVGEFAAWLALRGGGKTFYTTPIKALSNQKYGDFVDAHGVEDVGLLTGDNSINGEAPIVVMTTEVLRNMIYEDSPTLDGLRYVVLDEVHYLQNPYRGAVWEEILIHLPVDVRTVSLSATVSNAEEFGEWLQTLRGRAEVIIEEHRPVEIRHWYFASDELLPMFVQRPDGGVVPNPRAREFDRKKLRRGDRRPERGGRRPPRPRIPYRTDVIVRLQAEGMLPAIYFIFSRKGCDEAVRGCLRGNLSLTTSDERRRITDHVEGRVADLAPEELEVLGYDDWIAGLRQGFAAHHAGMIPPFKEAVEDLFTQGLVKAVFATETLSLGINMPARSVVIESLMKFTGETHEQITPGEYTQLSGRAGRRGIDELGHSIVLLQRFIPFDAITRMVLTRTYPLLSSFQPSYNMAVNLVRSYERDEAEHLVNSSLAQFQADRDIVRLEKKREQDAAYLASYRERMTCEAGDFEEYRQLWQRVRDLEGQLMRRAGRERAAAVRAAVDRLRPGDVFDVVGGARKGRYAVLEVVGPGGSQRAPRVVAISARRRLVRFSVADFGAPPIRIARLRPAKGWNARDSRARRAIARQLAAIDVPTAEARPDVDGSPELAELQSLTDKLEAHDCAACPELSRHLHFAERAARLERELAGLDRRMSRRTGTLARRFDRVVSVLEELGYVEDWALTDKGDDLTRVYNESDLLVVEAMERRLFNGLDPAELAAVCSSLVYETRGPEGPAPPELPTRRAAQAWALLYKAWGDIRRKEEARNLDLTREPDAGFAKQTHLWATGARLDEVLGAEDAPGDFVRLSKQLIDLLRQLEVIAPTDELRDTLAKAVASVQRGVVAYSSLESLEL